MSPVRIALLLCLALPPAALPAGAGVPLGGVSEYPDGGRSATAMLPAADRVVVYKSQRRMELWRHGAVLRDFRVSLGLSPKGPKERAGDFRTPEGVYRLTRRNPRSDYFLSIQVSYPNPDDVRAAHRAGTDPGGAIMVHGLPNVLRHPPDYYATQDWTDGCIALSNSDMVEFWLLTQDNIPIEILP